MFRGNQFDLAGRLAELNDRLDEFAFRLEVDAVIVETDHALNGASEQFVLGVDAGRFGQELDVKPFILEIAERFRELGRQINLLFDSADHERELFGESRRSGAHDRQRGNA